MSFRSGHYLLCSDCLPGTVLNTSFLNWSHVDSDNLVTSHTWDVEATPVSLEDADTERARGWVTCPRVSQTMYVVELASHQLRCVPRPLFCRTRCTHCLLSAPLTCWLNPTSCLHYSWLPKRHCICTLPLRIPSKLSLACLPALLLAPSQRFLSLFTSVPSQLSSYPSQSPQPGSCLFCPHTFGTVVLTQHFLTTSS